MVGSAVTTGNMRYPSDFGELNEQSLMKLLEAEDAFNKRTEEEGAVLVSNSGALPLEASERKITLFGRAVADPVYRSTSAGPNLNPKRLISLKDALEKAGFTINNALYDAYAASSTKRVKGTNASIGEENISFYTDSLKSSFSSYSDVAIVMFARDGGEGNDLNPIDFDGVRQLSLHKQEKDLLKMIKDSGVFKKTIVLINSGYPMELGWVEDPQYGVDACLWIGGPGLTGFTGVVSLLTGEANPSGRFTDTYAANSLSSPAMRNFGDFTFQNASGGAKKSKYIIEAENIYIGYKYYETRYQDQVLGINNADSTAGVFASSAGWNYAEEMDYPFGYGLSYTTFTQTLDSLSWDRSAKTVTASVTVKNTGSVAGKDVVELYVQLPYTDYDIQNGVEKSAIALIDHQKTGLLDNRNGVCTFMTEQALRQGPMKGFEGAFTVGGALSTMTSYNRIGCVDDCTCKALLTDVLRGEWGFKGFTITDAQTPTSDNMALAAIDAGTDMWCLSTSAYTYYRNLLDAQDAYAMSLVRQTNKRFYYAYLQSNLINGLETGVEVQEVTPWWKTALMWLDGALGVLTLIFAVMFIKNAYVKKKEEK